MKFFFKKVNKLNRGFTRTPKFGVTPKGGGFTILETLVAVSIFSVSLLGIMSILASSIANTTYAKEKMVASYLAQEGIEYIRNMRDTYVLYDSTSAQNGWNAFNTKLVSAPALCGGSNGCYFDTGSIIYTNHSQSTYISNLSINACSSFSCPNGALFYNSSTGKYDFTGTIKSGFTRKITIAQTSSNETKITSTVSWTQGSGPASITFSESLFNWMQ